MKKKIVTADPVMQEDIEQIAEEALFEWELFQHATVLVTGASGLIGRQLVMALLYANAVRQLHLRVIAFVHNRQKAERVFERCLTDSSLMIMAGDINRPLEIEEDVDYIIHAASVTSSKAFVERPVETIETAVNGCGNILRLAAAKKIRAGVYISSMEVYGISDQNPISESDYGYLDHTKVRSSYSESKKMCECMCGAYAGEYGVPFCIARLTQTFGPGVEENDARVFAQFAHAVISRKDIVLFSKGETVRNYCYTKDAVRAILLLLTKGGAGEAYNVANGETAISIIDMARMLIDEYSDGTFGVKIQPEDEKKHGFNPVATTCIGTQKLEALGWRPCTGLTEAFDRMIRSMRQRLPDGQSV